MNYLRYGCYIFIIIILLYLCSFFPITSSKIPLNNSIIIAWDIHCKKSILEYINNPVYNIFQKNKININIPEIGIIIQVNDNFICLMDKHPQQFNNIRLLIDDLANYIKSYPINKIISFSTAGSKHFPIGSILQFHRALVNEPNSYDIDFNYINSDYIFTKTNKFIDKPIINTKGFKSPHKEDIACGEDEFVIYMLSNKLKIPCLTLTGISDHNSPKIYNDGGGKYAATSIVNYFFNDYYL